MPFRWGNDDSGSSDSDGLPLTNDDGTAIDWASAAVFAVGTIAAEFYDGVARFVATLWNAFLIDPIDGASEWASSTITDLFGLPSTVVTLSVSETSRWMAQHPVVSMGLAVGFVLGISWLASRVIPRG